MIESDCPSGSSDRSSKILASPPFTIVGRRFMPRIAMFFVIGLVVVLSISLVGTDSIAKDVGSDAILTRAVCFSANGEWFAVATRDEVLVWSSQTYELIHQLKADKMRPNSLAISPDNRILAVGCDDGSIALWSLAEGKLIDTFVGRRDGILCLAYTPDGKRLVALAENNRNDISTTTCTLWDEAGKIQAFRELDDVRPIGKVLNFVPGTTDMLLAVKPSPDRPTGRILRVPLQAGKSQSLLENPTKMILSLDISSDGSTILVGGGNSVPAEKNPETTRILSPSLAIWHAKSGQVRMLAKGTEGDYVRAASVSPDGRQAYSTWPGKLEPPTDNRPFFQVTTTLNAWDIETERVRWSIQRKFLWIRHLAVSPNGKDLICCEDSSIWLIDAASGKILRNLHPQR